MLNVLTGLPDHVVGIRASGTVTRDDYQRVLIPEIESRLSRHNRLRFLYVFDAGFERFSAGAAWEDTKTGVRHLTQFERIAVVADIDWIAHLVRGFGFLVPGEVEVFATSGLNDAMAWISAPGGPGGRDTG